MTPEELDIIETKLWEWVELADKREALIRFYEVLEQSKFFATYGTRRLMDHLDGLPEHVDLARQLLVWLPGKYETELPELKQRVEAIGDELGQLNEETASQ